MKNSQFQKKVFEKYPVKEHKEMSDIVVLSIVRSIVTNRNKEKTFRILDVGCGGGQLLESFVRIPKIDVYGIDISEKALKIAQKRGYKTYLCDVESEKLPFDNDTFDVVIINDLLEHIIDPDNLLREIHRVLKNDGKLIINVPNVSHPASWFMQIFLDLPPMQSARYKSIHVRDYTLRILKAVLRFNGFKIERIKGTYIYSFNNIISRFIANIFPRLSERIIIICKKRDIPNVTLADVYFDIKEFLKKSEKI